MRPRQTGGGDRRIAVDGDVDIGHGPLEQRIAQPAADDPCRVAEDRQRSAQDLEAHPTYTRGSRLLIPQVIS